MTFEERLERLAEHLERLAEHQLNNRIDMDKLQVIAVNVLDDIKRLERIAYAHMVEIDDHDERLRKLKANLPKNPQNPQA